MRTILAILLLSAVVAAQTAIPAYSSFNWSIYDQDGNRIGPGQLHANNGYTVILDVMELFEIPPRPSDAQMPAVTWSGSTGVPPILPNVTSVLWQLVRETENEEILCREWRCFIDFTTGPNSYNFQFDAIDSGKLSSPSYHTSSLSIAVQP